MKEPNKNHDSFGSGSVWFLAKPAGSGMVRSGWVRVLSHLMSRRLINCSILIIITLRASWLRRGVL